MESLEFAYDFEDIEFGDVSGDCFDEDCVHVGIEGIKWWRVDIYLGADIDVHSLEVDRDTCRVRVSSYIPKFFELIVPLIADKPKLILYSLTLT